MTPDYFIWKIVSLVYRHRAGHSTETAVLEVLSAILLAIDVGDLSALVLLDLSAAFDTVDHDILIRRLKTSYMVCLVWCCKGSRHT